MAKYRPIFTKIWTDPDFQEYSRDERLIFIYLCTNPHTSESGIYPITCKTISQATDIELDEVIRILRENRMRNIKYDCENRVIFICNFLRYNGRGRKDLVIKSILNDYTNVKTSLWDEFKKQYPLFFERMLSLGKELDRATANAMSNPITKPNLNPNPTSNSTPNPITPTPNHNPNHTPQQVPVEKMFEIFENYWYLWNEGTYLHDYEAERQVAEILYTECLKDRPSDPLGLFKEKVEHLITKYDVKQFTGLPKYWNAAADKDRKIGSEEDKDEVNDN